MDPIDPRILEAALDGTLNVRDTANLIDAIVRGHSGPAQVEIVDSLVQRLRERSGVGSGRSGSEDEPERPYEPGAEERERQLTSAQRGLLGVARELLGPDWLLPWFMAERRLTIEPTDADVASYVLRGARESHALLALVIDQSFQFPSFQFERSGGIHLEVAEVNRRFKAREHPWAAASWWLNRDGRIGGARPMDLVDTDQARLLPVLADASLELVV